MFDRLGNVQHCLTAQPSNKILFDLVLTDQKKLDPDIWLYLNVDLICILDLFEPNGNLYTFSIPPFEHKQQNSSDAFGSTVCRDITKMTKYERWFFIYNSLYNFQVPANSLASWFWAPLKSYLLLSGLIRPLRKKNTQHWLTRKCGEILSTANRLCHYSF